VFAEQYDPEEDEEEDNNKVIFPKTDEQRTRLSDSVKNILLFRAIDPEQVNDLTFGIRFGLCNFPSASFRRTCNR
jgi:cAMP-dependent protein kinase regulator